MLVGFIIIVLPIVAIMSAVVYLPYAILINKRLGRQTFLWHFVKYAFVGYLISLIYLTLLWYYPDITFHPEAYLLNLEPFVWVRECYTMGKKKMIEQLVLNVGMFIPLGLLLPVISKNIRHLWSVALCVFAATTGIEVIQYFMGRSADIDDVIMNFLGGIIGYFLFKVVNKSCKNKKFWEGIMRNEEA